MAPLEIYLAPICPFAHRAWLALELLGIEHAVTEVDLTNKSPAFLEAYPRAVGAAKAPGAPAKVPVIRDAAFPEGLAESAVITAYLVSSTIGKDTPSGFLTQPTPQQAAHAQLAIDSVGGPMVKNFYGLLFAQEPEAQAAAAKELLAACAAWGAASEAAVAAAGGDDGPFFLGPRPSLIDALVYPWPARVGALASWRGFSVPQEPAYARYNAWVHAMGALPGVARTLRSDAFYAEGYAPYADGSRKPA